MGWCRAFVAAACLGILQLNSCQSRAYNTPVARTQRSVVESEAILPYPYAQDSYRHRRDANENGQIQETIQNVRQRLNFNLPLRVRIVVGNTRSNADSDNINSAITENYPDNTEPASIDVPSTGATGATTEGSQSETIPADTYTIDVTIDSTSESKVESGIVDGVAVAEVITATPEIITITETETITIPAVEPSGDDTSETVASSNPDGTPANGTAKGNKADTKAALVTDTLVKTTQIDSIIISSASAQGTDTATAEADTSSTAVPEDSAYSSVTSSASGDDAITDAFIYSDTITTVTETETISAAESEDSQSESTGATTTVSSDIVASDAYAEPSNVNGRSPAAVADRESNRGSMAESYVTKPSQSADESVTGATTPDTSTITAPTSDTDASTTKDSPTAYETSNTDGSTSGASEIDPLIINGPAMITESEVYSDVDEEGNSKAFVESSVSEPTEGVIAATTPETSTITAPTSNTDTPTTKDSPTAYETSNTDDSTSEAGPIDPASINEPAVITESEAYSGVDEEGNSKAIAKSSVSEATEGTENPQPIKVGVDEKFPPEIDTKRK